MEKFKKIDSQNAEMTISKTIVEKQIVNISDLVSERDSLIRTKNMETDEFAARVKFIDDQIEEHNAKIKQLTDLGIRAQTLAPEVPVEEVKEIVIPVQEEKVEEVVEEPDLAPTSDDVLEAQTTADVATNKKVVVSKK